MGTTIDLFETCICKFVTCITAFTQLPHLIYRYTWRKFCKKVRQYSLKKYPCRHIVLFVCFLFFFLFLFLFFVFFVYAKTIIFQLNALTSLLRLCQLIYLPIYLDVCNMSVCLLVFFLDSLFVYLYVTLYVPVAVYVFLSFVCLPPCLPACKHAH